MSETKKNLMAGIAPSSLKQKTFTSSIGLEFSDVTMVEAHTPSAGTLPPPTPGGDIFLRDVFLARATLSSTDSPGDRIIHDFNPVKAWLQNPLVQARAKGYKWLYGDFVLTALVTAPGGCYGAYNLQAVCEGGLSGVLADDIVDGPDCDSFATSMQDVYGVINCAAQNTVELHLPLFSPSSSVSLDPGDSLPTWRLIMWPLAPIASTAAPGASGSVSIYMRMVPGFVLEGRTMQSNPEFPVNLTPSAGPSLSSSIQNLLPDSVPPRPNPQRPTPATSPKQQVEYGASVLAAAAGSLLSGIRAKASAIFLSQTPPVTATFSDGELGSLYARWTVVRRVTIGTNTPLGHVCSIPVSPFLPYTDRGRDYHTPAGYVGLPYTFWRGSIEFMIYIPSHESVHGGLQIFWTPDEIVDFDDDPTNWLEGTAVSLSGTSAKKVRVGMSANAPTRECLIYRSGAQVEPRGANGFLVLYLTSEMTCPRPGASLSVLILSRACEDVKFTLPRHMTRRGEGRFRPYGEAYRLQGEENVVDQAAAPLETTSLLSGTAVPSTVSAASNIACMLRARSWGGQVRISRFPTEEGSNLFFIRPIPLPPLSLKGPKHENHLPNAAVSSPPWTWGGYFGSLFVGLKGSTRITLVARGGSLPRVAVSSCSGEELRTFPVQESAIAVNNVYGYNASPGMYGGVVIALPENEPVVINLPDEDPRPFFHARRADPFPDVGMQASNTSSFTPAYLRVLVGVSRPDSIVPVWIDYYFEGGDDFEGVRFRRVPGVKLEDIVRGE